jgi:hypothetical protein
MSNSWGGYIASSHVKDAIRFAFNNQVTFFASKGNKGVDDLHYPSDYDDEWVVSVGASGTDGQYKDEDNGEQGVQADEVESNFGNDVDLIAPGTSALVWTTQDGGGYESFRATSAATPHVSGVAALMLNHVTDQFSPTSLLAPEDIEQILQKSADDRTVNQAQTGYDDFTGWGLLNAGRALDTIQRPKYQIRHKATTNTDNVVKVDNNIAIVVAEGFNHVSAGTYEADRYEITTTHQFTLNTNEQLLDAWVRNSSADWMSLINPVLDQGGTEMLNYTQNQVEMKGHCYYIEKNYYSGQLIQEWIPYNPYNSNGQFAYSLHTKDSTATWIDDQEMKEQAAVKAYPNPATQHVNLELRIQNQSDVQVSLFNLQGQRLYNKQYRNRSAGRHQLTVPFENLASGTYLYQVKTQNGIYHGKVISTNGR